MFNSLRIRKVNGLKIIYRPKTADEFIMNEVFDMDVYGLDQLATSKAVNILDIGSHIGIFSLAAKKVCPNANIEGYELNKSNYILSIINNALNDLDITFYQKAVIPPKSSGVFPSDYMRVQEGSNTGAYTLFYSDQGEADLDVIYFDDLMNKKYHAIKMDIEGGEFPILENITLEKLANITKFLSIEFHGNFEYKTKYKHKKYARIEDAVEDLSRYFQVIRYTRYSWNLQMYVLKSKIFDGE